MLVTIENYIQILEPLTNKMPGKILEIFNVFKEAIPDYLNFPVLIHENKEEINNHLKIINSWYDYYKMKNTMNNISIQPFPEPLKQSEQNFNDAIDEHIENNGINSKSEHGKLEFKLIDQNKINIQPISEIKEVSESITLSTLEQLIVEQRKNNAKLSNRDITKIVGCTYYEFCLTLRNLFSKGILTDKKYISAKKAGRPKKY